MLRATIGLGVLLLAGCGAEAVPTQADTNTTDNWPGFRGPKRDDNSPDTGLLKEWPKNGPPLAWKATGVGTGFSSVAVVGNRICTMGDVGDTCYLFGLERSTGKQAWKLAVGKSGGNYAGPRCTPTVDGDSVYALGQFGDLVCVDVARGKERWRKNLPRDFKGQSGGWNYTESPLVDGERLVCTPGGGEATLVALNKKTGATLWKGAVPGGDAAGYSSVVTADVGGVRQYVQLLANGLVGFSADKGKLLWRYGTGGDRFGHNTANIPTPIVKGDHIFASAGYGRGGALLKVTSAGGSFNVSEEYWNRELNNKHGGVVLVGDYLYGDRDDSGRPWCAEFATGTVKWTAERSKGSGSASLTYADGNLYIRYNNGWVSLVPATPDKYEELGGFKIPNSDSNSWSHPVVIGGRLYLREKDVVWSYNVKTTQ